MSKKLITSNKVRVGDISISYYLKKATSADAKTIIFLHGFPFNKNTWRGQLQALPENVTGIAIDIRGHGQSTAGHGFFSIDCFAKDLRAFMDKLEIDRATLCGLSMGGYIALRAQEIFPERVAALVLVDTHSKADSNAAKQKRFDTIQAVLKHGRRPFAIASVGSLFGDKALQGNPKAVELVKSSIRRNNVRNICATLLALASRTDTTDSLAMFASPTLLIRGKEDKITAQADMLLMKERIKKATYLEIDHAGHLPNLEEEAVFNTALVDFINEIA